MLFRLYTLAAAFSVLTALLDVAAIHYSLNWIFSWFDMIVHFCGGAMVGVLIYTALFRRMNPLTAFLYGTLGVLCIGLAWEYFEYIAGLASPLEVGYVADTILDLVSDVSGGLCALYFSYRIVRKHTAQI